VLSGINPLHYLIALQEYKNQIVKEPEKWLPWTYQDSIVTLSLSAFGINRYFFIFAADRGGYRVLSIAYHAILA
jgi:hypothetical protein